MWMDVSEHRHGSSVLLQYCINVLLYSTVLYSCHSVLYCIPVIVNVCGESAWVDRHPSHRCVCVCVCVRALARMCVCVCVSFSSRILHLRSERYNAWLN